MLINNSRFEILTESGFSNFDSIKIKVSSANCMVSFTDGTSLGCTLNHLLKKKTKGFVTASSLLPGDLCGDKIVLSVELYRSSTIVYDLVNVEKNSEYITEGVTSHNCSFVGSSNTLISGEKIAATPLKTPTASSLDGFVAYYSPNPNNAYCVTVDVSEGGGEDYSAFIIFDITVLPYKIVATYRNNRINTLAYPEVIVKYANAYNQAFILVEANSLGQQVADTIFYDLEYENMYLSKSDQIFEGGYNNRPGVKTTKKTKMIGCNTIKAIVENDKLEVNDANVIDEMSTFTRRGATFKADEGKHDDLMMCLVMFGFLTTSTVFRNLFDFSLRKEFVRQQIEDIESDALPFGIMVDGTETEEEYPMFL